MEIIARLNLQTDTWRFEPGSGAKVREAIQFLSMPDFDFLNTRLPYFIIAGAEASMPEESNKERRLFIGTNHEINYYIEELKKELSKVYPAKANENRWMKIG